MPNQSNQTQPTSCPAPKEGSFRTTIGGQALIAQAMQQEGSLRGAARKLHMDPATLLRRKKKYQQAGLIGAEV